MTYILIAITLYSHAPTSTIVEFNTREACLAAAQELRKQASDWSYSKPVVLCAPKGASSKAGEKAK